VALGGGGKSKHVCKKERVVGCASISESFSEGREKAQDDGKGPEGNEGGKGGYGANLPPAAIENEGLFSGSGHMPVNEEEGLGKEIPKGDSGVGFLRQDFQGTIIGNRVGNLARKDYQRGGMR